MFNNIFPKNVNTITNYCQQVSKGDGVYVIKPYPVNDISQISVINFNNSFIENILFVVRDRLTQFQYGEFACEENYQAIKYLKLAEEELNKRSNRRNEMEGGYDTPDSKLIANRIYLNVLIQKCRDKHNEDNIEIFVYDEKLSDYEHLTNDNIDYYNKSIDDYLFYKNKCKEEGKEPEKRTGEISIRVNNCANLFRLDLDEVEEWN